ncbi:MAG: hypothetical protein ABSC23_06310 [Bryobacteraceae bacterium]|jgi:hypothetical protein
MGTLNPWHLSDAEFDAVMAEIDAELRKENDRIVGREIRGWMKFCQRFDVSMALGDPLADRIVAWFSALYGERLNVDMDFGKSFVVIRGDTYRMRCFRFYGVMYAICSVDTLGRKIRQRNAQGVERPVVNLLDGSIEGLTPELARRLSLAECGEILIRYFRVFCAFAAMEGALAARHAGQDAAYMKEATNDLLEASECMLRRTPNYGQSNWAALQATEKVIKSYILEKGGSHGKIHKLDELCACASTLGLPSPNPTMISAIQCKPDVRYDAWLVNKDQALAAYDAALIVCAETARYIRRSTAQASITQVRIRIGGNEPVSGLMLGYQPATPPFFTKPVA